MTLWISLSVALALPTPQLWWRWRKRENLNQENAHGRWKPPTLCELLKTVLKLFSNHTGILKKRRKKLKDWCQRQRSRQSSTLKKFSMKLRFIYIHTWRLHWYSCGNTNQIRLCQHWEIQKYSSGSVARTLQCGRTSVRKTLSSWAFLCQVSEAVPREQGVQVKMILSKKFWHRKQPTHDYLC